MCRTGQMSAHGLNTRLPTMVNDSPDISESLLDAARDGDEAAWRQLVDLLYPLVAGTIRNHLRREADRDDVAQEVFVKIFANLGQYAGRQPFDHWVSRITLNACRDWLRRMAARPLTSYSDLTDDEREILERTLASEDLAPDETPAMLNDLLDRMIAALAPREQIVIRLLDLEQRSVQDVCNHTGWGASKVKVTAMRARRKLAEQMQRLEVKSSSLPV
jgi:RNA polymerase sigma-70 factor (ECF subfamily)